MATIEGSLVGTGLHFAIIQARFNDLVGSRLLEGAIGALRQHGVDESAIDTFHVPGSWELPVAAWHIARSTRYDAIVALGVLIRGQTAHFEYIAGEATRGLGAISRETGIPVGFGVLTVENLEQAMDRAGAKMGNKGAEAALAALEMATLIRTLKS